MKERPILFSGPLVQAILAGRKTQTRRLVKPHPSDGAFYLLENWPHRSLDGVSSRIPGHEEPMPCPFGEPGDRLWVRETWGIRSTGDGTPSGSLERRRLCAGDCCSPRLLPGESLDYAASSDLGGPGWRPSIHMPRWASRLTLEVTGVRAERLQDISEEDAQAEGCEPEPVHGSWVITSREQGGHWSARKAFAALWDSVYGEGSWESNPWVWVVNFKRLEMSYV